MSKKKAGDTSNIHVNENGEPVYDDDSIENPNLEVQADDFEDEEGFQFDPSLLPAGVTLVDLAPDFVRPEGFLMVPRLIKKTGEIKPMTATFVGILHDIIPWKDKRGKERVWFACEATAAVPGQMFTGIEGEGEATKEFTKPVIAGTRLGISGTGAILALKSKKGHFIALHWTGNKVTVKNGEMWEIIARVSEKPVIEVKEAF